MKVVSIASFPEGNIISFNVSRKSDGLKFFDSLIWKYLCDKIDAANFVSVYLPDPDTPISIELPLGCIKILKIAIICRIASSKKTKSILLLDEKL